jgi:mannose-6-phosphate isomerase-like protein (cupin superfamily)
MGPRDGVAGKRIEETPYGALVGFAATGAFHLFPCSPANATAHFTASHDHGTSRHQVFEQRAATVSVAPNVNEFGQSGPCPATPACACGARQPPFPTRGDSYTGPEAQPRPWSREPGGMRELHWHPHAAEWQYYIKGSGRMTVFGSHGRARTDEFAAGDVGYVPQGYGHYIESTGSGDLEVMAVFNNGTYESISITAWMAANPDLLLSTQRRGDHARLSEPTGRAVCPRGASGVH